MMGYGRTGGGDEDSKGWPRVEELLRLGWACCCQKLPGNQFNKSDVVLENQCTGNERSGLWHKRHMYLSTYFMLLINLFIMVYVN
jgi:hypothetical protein